VGMSSLFFIGADRADPMPSENERQGRSSNIFFFTTVYCRDTMQRSIHSEFVCFFTALMMSECSVSLPDLLQA